MIVMMCWIESSFEFRLVFPQVSLLSYSRRFSISSRNALWEKVLSHEKNVLSLISSGNFTIKEVFLELAQSLDCRLKDSFYKSCMEYNNAVKLNDSKLCEEILNSINIDDLPPNIKTYMSPQVKKCIFEDYSDVISNFVRVRAKSFYIPDRSEPKRDLYMFGYKISIYNDGNQTIQVTGSSWTVSNALGFCEDFRATSIVGKQPIIPPGDVFSYQSLIPVRVSLDSSERFVGKMNGTFSILTSDDKRFNARIADVDLVRK